MWRLNDLTTETDIWPYSVNGTHDYLVLKELSGKGEMEGYSKVLLCGVIMLLEDRLWWIKDVQCKP